MATNQKKYQIRADYNDRTIAVYAAFDASIADVAVSQQKLLSPFSYQRMTWIKPSFLWLMYRSEWGKRPGMERILRIWVNRTDWDKALEEAILTTPEKHVYPDAKKWRKMLDKARIRVQWDPERDVKNQRLEFKSIQVGITAALSEQYAKRWITKIEDCTELTRSIRTCVYQRDFHAAEKLLPAEKNYLVNDRIAHALGMD